MWRRVGSFIVLYLEQLFKFSSRCDIKFQPICIYHCAPECPPLGNIPARNQRCDNTSSLLTPVTVANHLLSWFWSSLFHGMWHPVAVRELLKFLLNYKIASDVTAGAAARFHRSYFDHWRSKKWSKESIRVSKPNKGWSTDVTVAAHRGCARLKFRSNLNSKVSRTPSLLSSL